MNGMIVGMLKRKNEKYRNIVERLINNEPLTEQDKEFLEKEGVL